MPCRPAYNESKVVSLINRAGLCIMFCAALLFLPTLVWGQDTAFHDSFNQWLASSHVRLTKVGPDKEIVTPGTQFALQQDGLVLTNTKRNYAPSNNYRDGVIKPELAEIVGRKVAAGEAKIFNNGDKLWVTSIAINPKDNTVVLGLLSDQYDVNRFYGTLKFSTPKGSQPDAQLVEAMIMKTFSAAPSAGVATAAGASTPMTSSKAPVAPGIEIASGICPGLVKLVSTLPKDMINVAMLPSSSLPTKNDSPNTWETHTETFIVPGDQMTSIQAALAACPTGFGVDTPAKPDDGAMLSVLSKDDPPMHYRLAISSSKRQNSTFVVVSYSRTADLNQLSLMFATMAYVGTARDACGWPLTAPQAANFRRFGGLYYNKEIGQARARLEKKGRLDFCSDPAERAKYDRLAPTLFPVGDVGRLAP